MMSTRPRLMVRVSGSPNSPLLSTAVGVALTAVLSKGLFGEPLTRTMTMGLVLIIAGVVLLELGSAH